MEDQQPSFSSSEERSWWLLSLLPYCPSKDDIALETHHTTVTALPFSDEDDEVEEFILDDSYFGKIQTIIRNRDPKAIFNIRLSSNLPFPSENDFLELAHIKRRDSSERKSEINFMRISVRQQTRESVRKLIKYKDLSCLSQLPHELFLEILSHTHPIDLHALRRVNRDFRRFLSSPASNTIWRRSFALSSTPMVPLCPVDVNGWEWARLLFGSPRCDDCHDSYDCVNPDVVIRKRLCNPCLSEHLVRLNDDMPIPVVEQMSLVHDMIVKTFNQGTPADPGYTDPDHFVQADFDNVLVQQYACLQDGIDKGIDGAEAELEQYKTSRRSYVEMQLKCVRESNNWLIEADRYYRTKASGRFNHQLTLIQKRLRRDGFKDVDVNDAEQELRDYLSRECDPLYSCPQKTVVRYTSLTRSNWNKIRHGYCDIVQVYTKLRIQRERTELVNRTIQEFQKTTTPMSWRRWPPRYILYGMNPFKDILNLDAKYASDSCLKAACKRGKALLQSFIDDWLSGVKNSLRMDSYFEMEFGFELDDNTDPLDLATAVFVCLHCRRRQVGHCLIGWEDAVTHMHHPTHHQHDHRSISFSSPGYNTVCALLQLLDLDPASMLAVAMDQRDDRFMCLICGSSSRFAMNWREAAKHRHLHSEQSWKVVPSSLAVIIKKREASLDPRHAEDFWLCNHCPKHLHGLVSRRSVQTHVYEEHGICKARENTDFFYMVPYDGKISRNQFKLPGSALHQCLHCPLSLKLWNDTSLKQHQFGKHRIQLPTAGIDYCCVWEGFEEEALPPNE